MRKKVRKGAEYIARRTDRVTSLDLPPVEEARELLKLLGKADDRRFWRGHEPWPEDIEEVFGPVIDRLLALGVEVVDAVLELEPPDESWQADVAASLLARLVREGLAVDRVGDMVAWGLRWERDQAEGFTESMDEVVSRAGPAAEAPLVRYLEDHVDDGLAIAVVSFALQDADPVWTCAAATRLTREALDSGDVERASVLSYAAATACGGRAAPLVAEVLGRMVAGEVGRDGWLPCAFDASLLLGVHPGPAWADDVDRYLDGMTVEEFAAGYEVEDLLATARTDPTFLPRHELARACRLKGLEDGGSKPELVDRLEEARGEDPGNGSPRLEDFPTRDLRRICTEFHLDAEGTREESIGRLRGLEATGPRYGRQELDAFSVEELRKVCREMGLETGGKRRALVARVLLAQEERDRE